MTEAKTYGVLMTGDWFSYRDNVYMKTGYGALNISSGRFRPIENYETVYVKSGGMLFTTFVNQGDNAVCVKVEYR